MCCNTCAVIESDWVWLFCSPSPAYYFLTEAAHSDHDSSTFPPFGLLALLPFCKFSVSCLGEESPSFNTSSSTVQPGLHPAEAELVSAQTNPGQPLPRARVQQGTEGLQQGHGEGRGEKQP